MPKVRLALISDDVDPDEERDTYSIIRVFDKKVAIGFPVKESFVVSTFWDVSGTETFDQSLLVLDENRILARAEPLRVVLGKPQEVTFTRFRNVIFHVPGIYTVSILVNGESVKKISFIIEQLNFHS